MRISRDSAWTTDHQTLALPILRLRSRIAAFTILRKTGPVRGWVDPRPFLAATRMAFWKSPIGASFKINRRTPSRTSVRMASFSFSGALRRPLLLTHDASLSGRNFTWLSLDMMSEFAVRKAPTLTWKYRWPRSCLSRTVYLFRRPRLPRIFCARTMYGGSQLGVIAHRDGYVTSPFGGVPPKPAVDAPGSPDIPWGAVYAQRGIPAVASEGRELHRQPRLTTCRCSLATGLKGGGSCHRGRSWQFPGEYAVPTSRGCCERGFLRCPQPGGAVRRSACCSALRL